MASDVAICASLTSFLAYVVATYDGNCSGVTNGAVVPGRSRRGGAKQLYQKHFMIDDHKSEFDIKFTDQYFRDYFDSFFPCD